MDIQLVAYPPRPILSIGSWIMLPADETVTRQAFSNGTAWLELQPLTEGVTLTSDSGYGYGPYSDNAASVPEPGTFGITLVLLLSAVSISYCVRQRRKLAELESKFR
jgi:hypothetical protein